MPNSATPTRGAWLITATWVLCWRGCEGDGNEEGLSEGAPGRQIRCAEEATLESLELIIV
jgi:hypothetical protein